MLGHPARLYMNKHTASVINHFFKIHKTTTDHCHEPQETCTQKAIKAHSIPSGSVLSRLSRDGHVVMPRLLHDYPEPPTLLFKHIGRNQATTFTGLCAKHDNVIFRPIDDKTPDIGSDRDLFLLAYRATLREYHVTLQSAIRFQSMYQKRVEVGLSSENEPCSAGLSATSHIINAYDCYKYKRQLDGYYLSSQWSRMKHNVLVFQDQPPSVAVSSLFSLDDVDAPETPRVSLSVFHIDTNSVAVVFTATPRDARLVDLYLDRILSSELRLQKYLISKLILQSCENFVIDPLYYDSMPKGQQEVIHQFFNRTMHRTADDFDDERLYLF